MRSVCQGLCISTICARSYLIFIKIYETTTSFIIYIFRWGNWGTKKESNLPEVTRLPSSEARIQIQTCLDLKDNLSPTMLAYLFFPLEFGNNFRLKLYLVTLYNLQSLETKEGSETMLIYMFIEFSLSKHKWRRKKGMLKA